MSGPASGRGAALGLARGLALLVAVGCFGAIAWQVRERPDPPAAPPGATAPAAAARLVRPAPAAAVADRAGCLERRKAEIDGLRAKGEIDAERAMMLRQAAARQCE